MPTITSLGFRHNRIQEAPLNRVDQPDPNKNWGFSDVIGGLPVDSVGIEKLIIKSGQTTFNNGLGYWLGIENGYPKFSLGDGSTYYFYFDGETGEIKLSADVIDIDTGSGTISGQLANIINDVLGENVTAGDVLYLKTSDKKWWKADGSAASTADNVNGIAFESGSADETKKVQIRGYADTVTGLSAAGLVYLSDTAGTASNSAGTYRKVIGFSPDGSGMIINPFIRPQDLAGVGTTVTATNLDTLTDGSEASALHYHKLSVLQSTYALDTASGDLDIAHGLGVTPKYVQVIARYRQSTGFNAGQYADYGICSSDGWSDGSTSSCSYSGTNGWNAVNGQTRFIAGNQSSYCTYITTKESNADSRTQSASASFDDTNVTLSWTKTDGGTPAENGTIYLTIIVYS